MARKPMTICQKFNQDSLAKHISYTWHTYNTQRQEQLEGWKEIRDYVFATDTTTTSNRSLPWKNSTTLPKLCQIRDNLHSNYVSALFPNDEWLKWIAYSQEDATKEKAETITAYMSNKAREGGFRQVASQLLYDYIDYGNAFGTHYFESRFKENVNSLLVTEFIGPKAKRISPMDIVFDPLAESFKDSFKVIRALKSVGELYAMADAEPDNHYLRDALKNREALQNYNNGYGTEDHYKGDGLMVDGFGSYYEYLGQDYVEILEYWGDIFDKENKRYLKSKVITVIDRMWVIRNEDIPSWMGAAPIYHVGWRTRPDNLWAMGPLENLVGMQYRIDHLENLKADAMDLAVLPPLVIAGEVEEFNWAPGVEIHIDENGTVTELGKNAQWVIQAENGIQLLEQRMEMYAGAPREAMGIRTAGEKTAFEVQQLQNAAGRIFQEKINAFETQLLEPLLNGMFENAARNMDAKDVVSVLDDDLGVVKFLEITRDDITASGKLRPIGARHFAAQAQLVQNLQTLSSGLIWQQIAPHTSSLRLAKLVEDVLGLERYQLFEPNIAIVEQQDTQRMAQQSQENLGVEQQLMQGAQ